MPKTDNDERSRIDENISNAEKLRNPLEHLEPYTTVEYNTKQSKSSCDDNCSNPSSAEQLHIERKFRIKFYKSPLPSDLHDSCMSLFKDNMSKLYEASSWGLDLESKSEELRHESARFLIVTEEIKEIPSSSMNQSSLNSLVRSFSHFRFEVNDDDFPTEEVIYLYEIQVHPDAQKCGIGKRCMSIIELVGLKTKMKRVLLTVFKNNNRAMEFYLNKMKYNIDESSPSNYKGEEADYEILSKTLISKRIKKR